MANTQLCALLFADIVRSSDIKADDLKSKLAHSNLRLMERIKAEKQVIVAKPTGDGFFICGPDASELSEAALLTRDHYRNTDWKRAGYPSDVRIRIALDLQKVNLIVDGGKVVDVAGQGIDRAARLEPITDPNAVWCSQRFASQLVHDHVSNVVTVSLGSKALPKGAGDEVMSVVRWATEASSPELDRSTISKPSGPRIPRRISQMEMDKFVEDGFGRVRDFFKESLVAAQRSNPEHISYRLKEVTTLKFSVDLYVDGDTVARCKIWLGGGGSEILYSSGRFDLDSDNSYNEAIHVSNDGIEISFQPLGMPMVSGAREKLALDDIGSYLWSVFERSFPSRRQLV